MSRMYKVLVVFILSVSFALHARAQCDSIALAPDSLQWVLGAAENSEPILKRYKDTMYLAGRFEYIGRYTGSCIGLNRKTGEVLNQPTWPKVNGHVSTVIPDGIGGIIIGGQFSMVGDSVRGNLAQINSSGQVTAFNQACNAEVMCAIVHNGTLYIGGRFAQVGGSSRSRLASVNISTGQLTSWAPTVGFSYVETMATDGTSLFVGGEFSQINSSSRDNIASFDISTGNLTNWNPGAGSSSAIVKTLYVHGNTLYVGGDFTTLAGTARKNIGAFNLTTGNLTPWNPSANSSVHAILARNGEVYLAGNFSVIGTFIRRKLAVVDSTTALANNWAPISEVGGRVNTIALVNDTLYAGGGLFCTDFQNRNYYGFIAINSSTGNILDVRANTYNDDSAHVLSMHVQGNKLYVGGMFPSIGGYERHNIAGIDLVNDEVIDLSAFVTQAPVNDLLFHNDTMYIGGAFTHVLDPAGQLVGQRARHRLASFDIANGYALTPWNPLGGVGLGTGDVVEALEVYGNYIYVGGSIDFVKSSITYNAMFRADKTTGTIDSWQPNLYDQYNGSSFSTEVFDLQLVGTKLYMSGFLGTPNSNARGGIMYHDLANSNQSYGDYDYAVKNMLYDVGKMYLGGGFTKYSNTVRRGGAAFDTSSFGNLLPWNPNLTQVEQIYNMAKIKNRVYLCGGFTEVAGKTRIGLAAVDTSGGNLWTWQPQFYAPSTIGPVTGVYPYGDTVYVSGTFTQVNGKKLTGLARFHFDNYRMPDVSITTSADSVCDGTKVTLTATANISSVDYQWILNGSNSGPNSPTFNYTPGNGDGVKCKITVPAAAGCVTSDTAISNTQIMKVDPVITPGINIFGPTAAGKFAPVNLTATVLDAGSNYNINWQNNGTTFANTSGPSVTYTKDNGTDSITATITAVGCYDTVTSNKVVVEERVGIHDVHTNGGIAAYPNPADEYLHISGISAGATIRLSDAVGKVVLSNMSSGNKQTLNMANLPAGTYILQVKDADGSTLTKSIVKE